MSKKRQSEGELPETLVRLIDGIVDRELATRLTDVMIAAGRCIEQLAAINLRDLEPKDADDGAPDLTLWEKMAPAVSNTVVAVNELCIVIDECFPPGRSRTSMFGEEGSDQRAEFEAAAVFRAVSPLLKREVQDVGQLMRRPDLLSSPWALLGELQDLRSQLRDRVSDGVYLSAGALGTLTREQVVPGFAQEVLRALSFRGTESALRKTAMGRLEAPTDGVSLAKALDEDFAVLTSMPAWRHVKMETKRAMLRLRTELKNAAEMETSVSNVEGLVRPMMELLAETSQELSRSVLVSHDREAQSGAQRRVEQAQLHLQLQTGAGGWALEAAFDAANPLRGLEGHLDTLLRDAGKMSVGELPDEELRELAARLSTSLARIDL